MSFRLPAILWSLALLATGFASTRVPGLLAAVAIIILSGAVIGRMKSPYADLLVPSAVILLVTSLLLRTVQYVQEEARRATCLPAQLAFALRSYISEHGTLPTAQSRANAGAPPKSWRVSLVGAFSDSSVRATIATYRSDEPWDSDFNKHIAQLERFGMYYSCPNDPPATTEVMKTHFFAIVDPRTAWPSERGRALSEITDDHSHTLVLMEVAGRDVPWSKPEDLTFDEAVEVLTAEDSPAAAHFLPPMYSDFFTNSTGAGINVVFANGRSGYLPLPLEKNLAVALLTVNGGESIEESDIKRSTQRTLNYPRVFAFGAFLLLALLPAARFVLRKAGNTAQPVA